MPQGNTTAPRVLIHGLQRSGTSWLLKIFDQHPGVFSVHEPELLLKSNMLPRDRDEMTQSEIDDWARTYSERLFATRALRAVRRRPLVRKTFHSTLSHWARLSMIYGLSAIEKFPLLPTRFVSGAPIPTFADLRQIPLVVKGVRGQMVLPDVARNRPDVRFILIVRHPCGNALSAVRGYECGKMPKNFLPRRSLWMDLFDLEGDMTRMSEENFTQYEVSAYRWAVLTNIVYSEVQDLPNVRVVTYENLCNSPIEVTKDLFDFAGISWHDNVEAFLQASLDSETGGAGYHDVVRNPAIAANRWREEMPRKDIAAVARISLRSSAAALFPDLEQLAGE